MAVTAVSGGDTTRVRHKHVRLVDMMLNIAELVEIGDALVNAPGGLGSGVLANIPVDNTSAGFDQIGIGIFTRIFNGTAKAWEGNTRRGNLADTLRVNSFRSGDSGRAQNEMTAIADNAVVRQYDVIVPTAVRSDIDITTKELKKLYDVLYTDETIEPQPVVNRGGSLWAEVDSGTTVATFDLDASDSFSFNGNPLDYDWNIPTGITITVGVDTDPAITIEADPGQYSLNLAVTDSVTTKVKSSVRWLFAVDNDVYKAFSQRYTIASIDMDTSDRVGWKFRFTVVGSAGNLPTEDNFLYVGAPVLVSYRWQYRENDTDAWENLDDADGARNFNGYIVGFSEAVARGDGTFAITIDVEGTAHYYNRLPLATQVLNESDAPVEWTEVATALNNPKFVIYYCFNQHSRSLDRIVDFYDNDDFDAYQRASYLIRAGKMLPGMQSVAALVPGGNIGSLPNGGITLRKLISYQDDTYRAALNNRFTFTAADIMSTDDSTPAQISYSWQPLYQYAEAEGGCFIYGASGTTTAIKGRFGLLAPSQGDGVTQFSDFIIEDQGSGAANEAVALEVVGHHMAYMNRPLVSFGWSIKFDLIEPARLEPVALDSSLAAYWPIGVMPERAVPLAVSRRWDLSVPGTPPQIEITFEPVTRGEPATKLDPSELGNGYTPVDPSCGACGSPTLTTYAATLPDSYWSGASMTYGASTPARKATTNITFTLPQADCFSQVSIPLAGQSGWAWASANLTIDGVNYGAPTSGGVIQTSCDDVSPAPLTWTLGSPVSGRVLFFEGTGITGTGSLSAPTAIFCVKLGLCE